MTVTTIDSAHFALSPNRWSTVLCWLYLVTCGNLIIECSGDVFPALVAAAIMIVGPFHSAYSQHPVWGNMWGYWITLELQMQTIRNNCIAFNWWSPPCWDTSISLQTRLMLSSLCCSVLRGSSNLLHDFVIVDECITMLWSVSVLILLWACMCIRFSNAKLVNGPTSIHSLKPYVKV